MRCPCLRKHSARRAARDCSVLTDPAWAAAMPASTRTIGSSLFMSNLPNSELPIKQQQGSTQFALQIEFELRVANAHEIAQRRPKWIEDTGQQWPKTRRGLKAQAPGAQIEQRIGRTKRRRSRNSSRTSGCNMVRRQNRRKWHCRRPMRTL
jgi:hypothetical protein